MKNRLNNGKISGGWRLGLVVITSFAMILTASGFSAAMDQPGTQSDPVLLLAQNTTDKKSDEEVSKEGKEAIFYKVLDDAMYKMSAELESISKEEGLTEEEKKRKALRFTYLVRYGPEKKDSFWIIDNQGKMLMDPYLPDLIGKDLFLYVNPDGQQVFKEMLDLVRKNGEGYLEFLWPKYDSEKLVKKIAYVRTAPFSVVGTGLYADELDALTDWYSAQTATSPVLGVQLSQTPFIPPVTPVLGEEEEASPIGQ